ncbi:MAG TPA: ABC transporter permease [Candidatus Acidoferrales bacterium]|nr:ABC transporter permease [Candidatus Acidoferrales bacterium]
MTGSQAGAEGDPGRPTATRPRERLGPGWPVIASKEFADHVLSARFYVLLVILGVAALIPLYFAADQIRNAASAVSGANAVFLFLFTVGPPNISLLRVDQFVGIAAPLLGVAFAFDAINGERHEGTLPRLLSQPIHRDDVINGKFVAGLAVIALVLAAVVAIVAGFGLLRLGIVPSSGEVVRLLGWYLVTVLYVALWLAFGMLLSVVIQRAATSALIGLGVWLFVAVPIFGQLIVSIVGGFVTPASGSANDILSAAAGQQFLLRLLPSTLYSEASIVLLDPSVTAVSTPATLGQYVQAQQQVPSLLSLDQSLLLVWPHIVALLALTAACFAVAYVAFMRQEVRA